MALSHPRPSSPDPSKGPTADADAANVIKKIKTSNVSPSNPAAVPQEFATGVFDHNNIARLHTSYLASDPYKHALVEKLFQDDLLNKVKDEIRSELNFTTKETDIYKVNQTGDLASLSYLESSQLSLLPNLLALRNALYSKTFRDFLRSVTGCGPLSGSKQDMSVNSYTKGCHLLNHDDVIGTRRVSYILYMPLPNYQIWQKEWGGALELYPVREGTDEPEPVPSKTVPPSWNQFIFFEVQPGQSFHSVEEVVVGGEGEDGRERLSISGWFHAAQEGEEGYSPESDTVHRSSREQLTSTQTSFRPYSSDAAPPMPSAELSEEHVNFLSEFLNPVYLQPRTMKALASRFVEESSLELHSFLAEPLASKLEPGLRALDERDGLGPQRKGTIPPHTAGIDTSDSTTPTAVPTNVPSTNGSPSPPIPPLPSWVLKGPPHKWRYCALTPPSPSNVTTLVTPRSFFTSPAALMRSLQDELFPSAAFRAWLTIVTTLLPMACEAEARRFRPGLDYRLATSEEKEARLDVILGLTPEALDESDDQKIGGSKAQKKQIQEQVPRGWQTGEWGGWECYMAPHDEEDDPAVYRASSRKKAQQTNGHSNGTSHNGHASQEDRESCGDGCGNCACNGGGCSKSEGDCCKSNGDKVMDGENGVVEEEEDAMDEDEDEDEEEDNTLLTVQPGYNRLLLVLRDERVMRFVKYVSAAASGSRWDVCGEYEVGAIEEDDA